METPNAFKSYKSTHVELSDVVQPPDGRYNFVVKKAFYTNDRYRTLNNPELKTDLPQWKDHTDQVAVVCWTEEGVITYRFHAYGFVRFDNLPEDQKELHLRLGDDGYAVNKETMERVKSPEKTAQCMQIMHQFFTACGLEEGSSVEDLPDCKFSAEVYTTSYNGKDSKKLKGFRMVSDNAVVDVTEKVEQQYSQY